MPQNGYDGPLTLAANQNRLVTLLIAAGFTGRFGFKAATIKNNSGASIFVARDSAVTDNGAHKGREIENGDSYTWPALAKGTHDFYQMYAYSAGGGEIIFDCACR
jgi:hypothetical protein